LEADMTVQTGHPLRFAIAVFSIGLIAGCGKAPDPREDLVASLGGANVEGYNFAFAETADQKVSSLTNASADKLMTLPKEDAKVVLRYTRVENRKANTKTLFRTEVIKRGGALTLSVADLSANTVKDWPLPPPDPRCTREYPSINACTDDFFCSNKGPMQCQANRTCEPQKAALYCCVTGEGSYSVHVVVPPDTFSRACVLRDVLPNFEGLVLSNR
jgi:hypothetical protein